MQCLLQILVRIIVSIVGLKLRCFRVDTYYYSDQLYTHVQIANFVTAVTQSNSVAVTENLHTHFSGWTTAVRQSIENFYEGLLVSVAHDIGRIVGAFKFT